MDKKIYCCEFCNKFFKGRSAKVNKNKHILHCSKNPESESYVCEKCNREFNNRHSFIGHNAWCGKIRKNKTENNKIEKTKKNEYKCKYCEMKIENSAKLGGHVASCKFNPNFENIRNKRIAANKIITRTHSQETKDKISKSRKDFLKNNPDKVPYLLNHSSKESYPEKYFTEVFENENIDVVKKFRIGLYELDFCILSKKIDIEIDGSQHYSDKKILISDKRRTDFLESNGWNVVRIDWMKYQRLNKEEKESFIYNLKSYIDNLSIKPEMENYKKSKKDKNSCCCGKEKWKTAVMCYQCRSVARRKVERPTLDQLLSDVGNLGYTGTGTKYGVSNSSIKKWIKKYKKEQD